MFHILIIVCPRSSTFFFISNSLNVFEDYSKTPLLFRFVYVKFRVLAFKLFRNVYVCDRALWLDLNLLNYDLFYESISPAATSFNTCKNNEKLSILATKMGGDLAIFSTPPLMLVSSSSSSNPSKELVIGTGLLGICSFLFIYEALTFRGCSLFIANFSPFTFVYEAFTFVFCM